MASGMVISRTRVLSALVLCVAIVVSIIATARANIGHEVQSLGALRVVQASLLEAGQSYPSGPPDMQGLRAVSLPDNWDGQRPDYLGYVWYRIDWPEAASQWRRPAVYLPAAGMNAEVWINGQRAGGAGRMEIPPSRHFYTPQLIEIAPGLLNRQGSDNAVWVLVVGNPGYRSGLGALWLGEHHDLFDAWRARRFWQIEGNAATIVINFSMAVFVLLVGWREQAHSAYIWFGSAVAMWATRNLNYWVTNPVIPDLLFAELCVSGEAWFTALFAIFAMRFAELNQPGYKPPRWLQPVAIGFALCATLYFVSASSYTRANAGFAVLAAIGMLLVLWSTWRLIALALAQRTPHLLAVACGAATYLLLLMNDYAIGINRSSLGEIYLRQYAALPLFIAVTTTLAKRYAQALQRSRELATSLQTQVQAQRAQLEASFQQLREAEREQARTQERARVMGDLHDGLGLHLVTALRQARNSEAPREVLADVLQDCLDELRVAVDSLDEQERDPQTLLGTLRFRMAPRFEALGVRLNWQVDDALHDLPTLDPSQALNLLRIVQELLGNALKHSEATEVTMSLSSNAQGTVIGVHDNGRGFDPATVRQGRGLGNLGQRAQRIGARLEWTHLPGGTGVTLLLAHP